MKVEIFAAADPIEISREDLTKDHKEEIRKLVGQLEGMDPKDVEDQVYVKFEYDLCQSCRNKLYEYISNISDNK